MPYVIRLTLAILYLLIMGRLFYKLMQWLGDYFDFVGKFLWIINKIKKIITKKAYR